MVEENSKKNKRNLVLTSSQQAHGVYCGVCFLSKVHYHSQGPNMYQLQSHKIRCKCKCKCKWQCIKLLCLSFEMFFVFKDLFKKIQIKLAHVKCFYTEVLVGDVGISSTED
jgi:hypothetical protein